MDRRLIFRHPHGKVEPAGDAGLIRVGVLDAPVPQGRQLDLEARETSGHEKPAGDEPARPVPQSDTGVLGEYPKAFGRTLVKELGKMTPYLRYKGCSLATGEPQRIGSSDCLSKTQDSANSQEDV